jgi:hypothetical protein
MRLQARMRVSFDTTSTVIGRIAVGELIFSTKALKVPEISRRP